MVPLGCTALHFMACSHATAMQSAWAASQISVSRQEIQYQNTVCRLCFSFSSLLFPAPPRKSLARAKAGSESKHLAARHAARALDGFFFPSFFLFNLQRDARVWISSLGIFPWPVGREHTHSRDCLVRVTGWVVDLGAPVGSKHNRAEVSRRKHFLFIHWVMEAKLCFSFSC